MKRLYCALLAPVLVMGLAGVASAFTLIDGGTMNFTYSQLPAGPYGGVFQSDGELLPGIDVGGGTTGVLVDVPGEYWLVVMAGLRDPIGNVDAAVIYMKSPLPFIPGEYPVDPVGGTAYFSFIDDADSFSVPPNPGTIDWIQWLSQLVAERKFVSVQGSIKLSSLGSNHITGSFSGLTAEYNDGMPLVVSGGNFEVYGPALQVETTTWADLKASYRE